jgi:hypothetical protein
MAVKSTQLTIGTTPTLIVGETQSPKSVMVSGQSVGNVFIGGSDVTTTNGTDAGKLEGVVLRLNQTDSLYGIVSSGTHTLQVLTIT